MKIIRKRELAKLLDISYQKACLVFDSHLAFDKFRYNKSRFIYTYTVDFLNELKSYFENKMNNSPRTSDKCWNNKRINKINNLIKKLSK